MSKKKGTSFKATVQAQNHRAELETIAGGIAPDLSPNDWAKLRGALTIAGQFIEAKDPWFVGDAAEVEVIVDFTDDSLAISVAKA